MTLFIQTRTAPREFTTLWIRKDTTKARLFHCPVCSCPIFKYQGQIVMIMPGNVDAEKEMRVLKFPMEIKCPGHSKTYGYCNCNYVIEGFAE